MNRLLRSSTFPGSLFSASCRTMPPAASSLLCTTLLLVSVVIALTLSSSAAVWSQTRSDDFSSEGPTRSSKPFLAGIVEILHGSGSANDTRPLEPNSDVFIGDLIRTGPKSRMTLRLGTRTRLRLGEKTALRIDRFVVDLGGDFDLSTGAILFDREPPILDNQTFEIKTKYGLIAVRGTRFFAGRSRGRFGVFVEKGKVEVSAAGTSVTLDPAEGTDISAPGNPPSVPKIWGADRVREALATVQ
jgi:FecR protein